MAAEERTLINEPTYQSKLTAGDYEVRVTHNGGATWSVATLKADGNLIGDRDDLETIVATASDCDIDNVSEVLENLTIEEWFRFQRDDEIYVADLRSDVE